MKTLLIRGWRGWTRIAQWIGDKQAALIYGLLYVVLVVPISLVARPFWDPFQYRNRGNATFWAPRNTGPATLEEARRQ